MAWLPVPSSVLVEAVPATVVVPVPTKISPLSVLAEVIVSVPVPSRYPSAVVYVGTDTLPLIVHSPLSWCTVEIVKVAAAGMIAWALSRWKVPAPVRLGIVVVPPVTCSVAPLLTAKLPVVVPLSPVPSCSSPD